MRIAICDDDPIELERVKSTAVRYAASKLCDDAISVDAFLGGDELLHGLKRLGGADLVILDILMPGMNGIELARKIRQSGDNCRILFLTSSPEFAVDSYQVNAFYYLLKPYSEAGLSELIGRALMATENERGNSVVVKSNGKITRLSLGSIRYVESVNHHVYFFLRDGSSVGCFSSLNEFHAPLLRDKRFVKCHKSFIVNMDYVSSVSGKDFSLIGNERIPISRNTYQQVKAAYFDYFFDKGSRRG